MSATRERLPNRRAIVRFPPRASFAVWVTRDAAGAWLVLAGSHGWLHGDYFAALDDAEWLSRNLGLPIRGPR